MKKLAKLAALLAAGALALGFAACSGDDDNDPPKKPEVTATLEAESSSPVELVAGVTDGTPVSATLTLANDVFSEAVTSADDLDGLIEADAGEKAEVISVTLEEQLTEASVAKIVIEIAAAEGAVVGDSGTITVRVTGAALANTSEAVTAEGGIAYTVVNLPEGPHPVTDVSVTPQTASVKVGEEKQLTANVLPAYADNKKVTWTSDKPGIATVDESGKVKGVAKGEAVITATTEDGGHTDSCTVTVTETPQSGGTPHKDVIIDVSSLSTFADGDALSPEANIKAVGALTVEDNTKKSTFAGKAISPSKRLKLDETISSKGLEVNLAGNATILVYAYSGSSGTARSLALYDADKQIIEETTQSIGDGSKDILNVAVFKVKANTTYYIGAVDKGINIYYIAVLGTFTEEDAETFDAQAATCTKDGNPAYKTTNYGRYILSDGTAVPYCDVIKAALGHKYVQDGVPTTYPTANTTGSVNLRCENDNSHTSSVILPALATEGAYTRNASSDKTEYTYEDPATKATIKFTADTVEEKHKEYFTWTIAPTADNKYGVVTAAPDTDSGALTFSYAPKAESSLEDTYFKIDGNAAKATVGLSLTAGQTVKFDISGYGGSAIKVAVNESSSTGSATTSSDTADITSGTSSVMATATVTYEVAQTGSITFELTRATGSTVRMSEIKVSVSKPE